MLEKISRSVRTFFYIYLLSLMVWASGNHMTKRSIDPPAPASRRERTVTLATEGRFWMRERESVSGKTVMCSSSVMYR